jgi:hypothetical protein
MRSRSRTWFVVLASFTLLVPVAASARAAGPSIVALNRCNSERVDEAFARVRDYDGHTPGNSPTQLLRRYAAIVDVLAALREEREVLDSICSSDGSRAPLFAEIAATAAWALTLEADLAGRLNASCPAAASAFPTMMLADAWLSMANVVNDSNGTVPAIFGGVIPKVQTGAAAVGLTLPSWPDTSAYWRDSVHAKAKAAIASCPSPSPSPTP